MTNLSESNQNFYIIAIGASAGGVQALESFFSHLPDQPNGAFVVVQHLSSDHRSLMREILQRQTAMPVKTIEDEMEIQASQTYILPPGKHLILKNRCFCLIEKPSSFDYPINKFFKSLAQEWGEKTVAILLSGTGNDGTEGIQAISKVGGIGLVQSPETAEFNSMPSSAIPSGSVDEILSPQDLAQTVFELIRYSDNFAESSGDETVLIDSEKMQQILNILAEREEIDFYHYKVSTLSRRINHCCALSNSKSIEAYIRRLQNSPEEQKRLRQNLLIGVTEFFRDPPAWEFLKAEVLPQIIRGLQPEEQLRIWVSACATGEEAYSMAIIVHEVLAQSDRSIQVKIFATDVDTDALETTAKGIYPESISKNVSCERLEQYFTFSGGNFQVKRFLREMLVVAPHNLTNNTGFSKMNLVSCRNALIYMRPRLQEQVIRLLHFALAAGGILFLGNSESLGNLADEFEPLSRWKVYRKRRNLPFSMSPIARQTTVTPLANSASIKSKADHQFNRLLKQVFKYSLRERRVTCLLVNLDHKLLRVFYDAAQLLEFPIGEVDLDVTELVAPAIKLPLSTALYRAKREQQSVLYTGIPINRGEEQLHVSLQVGFEADNVEDYLIVVLEIEELTSLPATAVRFEVNEETAHSFKELEYELQQTRENLQVTIKELEASNEEQQTTNEELLASNEELHSVNEELYTVNSEHQSKIEELTQLNNDIDNLLRSTNIGVVFLDRNLHIRKFTPAATVAINLKPEDIGRLLTDITNNLDCHNLSDILDQVVERQEAIQQEVSIAKTGEHLLMRVNLYLQEDGESDGIVITFVNIDQVKQIQNQLERANSLLENLYATSPAGLALHDQNLKFVRINQALADINGRSIREHIDKTPRDIIPELADEIESILRQAIETNQPIYNIEIRGSTRVNPEVERCWNASYYPVDLLDGKRGVGSVITEITERKQIEAELMRQNHALEEAVAVAQAADSANLAKSDFLANMSHEIRTPINAILSVTQLLNFSELNSEQRSLLDILKSNGDRLLGLIDEILDLSKIEAKELKLNLQEFCLATLAQSLNDAFKPQAAEKGLEFKVKVDSNLPSSLIGDDFRLYQVLSNLVTNALKFTEKGTITVTIRPADSNQSSPISVHCRVQDTGIGIRADQQAQLFQAFTQADNSTTRQYGGTGLGLAICRRIVELMDGEIGVESTPGQGSTFWFTVPLAVADMIDNPSETHSSPPPEVKNSNGADSAPINREQTRLLVVEDYPDNRELLLCMLQTMGYEADWADNGQSALDRLAQQEYDLILMDCQMPLVDGYQATQRLRQRESESGLGPTVVIGLTAHAMSGDRQRCLDAGMNDYLTKPIDMTKLIDRIQHWTQQS